MRIGISTSVIQRARTGVGQYVLALVKALMPYASRHEFTLFVLEEDRPLFAFAEKSMRIVDVSETFRPPLRDIGWHQTLLPKAARTLGLDVLHIPSYRRMIWRHPCRLVTTIHDLAPFRVKRKYDVARMIYCRSVVPWLARRQHRIITPSTVTAQDVQAFLGVAPEQIEVIHNGIDQDRFQPGAAKTALEAVARKYQLKSPFILYIARLEHPGKNHVRLIEAFDTFKRRTSSDCSLVFCGGDWHGAEAIHTAIRSSAYSEAIRSLGFVPDGDLPDLYRAAQVFIYPSLYEGFGFPPLEAMACGCPVISSDTGALREVIGEAACVINPEDVGSISEALCSWDRIRSTQEWVNLGLKQAQGFSWERTASRTVGVYEALIRSNDKKTCVALTGSAS